MKLLLDSHTLLWFVWNHPDLSAVAHHLIVDPKNTLLLSTATIWEIAIKVSIGKLTLTEAYDDFMFQAITTTGLNILPIEVRHANAQITLPFHHRDPFDRMLIAQSIVENIPLVSVDSIFDTYPVQRLW